MGSFRVASAPITVPITILLPPAVSKAITTKILSPINPFRTTAAIVFLRFIQRIGRGNTPRGYISAPAPPAGLLGDVSSTLDLDINMDQTDGCRRYPCDAAGLPQRQRPQPRERLLHLARQAAHRVIVEPRRNCALLRLPHLLHRAPLLVEVAGVF